MTTMTAISAADVNRLRQTTGAGMMECKKALTEANGDFDKAIEILRKKGQKVAASRAERDAKEGIVLAKTSADGKKGILVSVNSETDFVARNQEFADFVENVSKIAIEKYPASVEELRALNYSGTLSISDKLTELIGKIGEKLDVSRLETISAEKVASYIHPGNKLAVIIGFTKNINDETGRNIAMIFKEGLSNILKHAKASNVLLQVEQSQEHFIITLRDNGAGFELKENKNSFGLANMQQRTSRVGAKLNVNSHPKNGTEIILTLNK